MKDSYDGLNSLLKQVAVEIAATIPENFDIDVNVIYFPQLGFNIAIPLNERGEAAFDGSDSSWELIFVTENRAYFKDFRMIEMDKTLGDIYGLICGERGYSNGSLRWSLTASRERNRDCLRTGSACACIRGHPYRSFGCLRRTGQVNCQYSIMDQTTYTCQPSCHDAGSELLQTCASQNGAGEYSQYQRRPVRLVARRPDGY